MTDILPSSLFQAISFQHCRVSRLQAVSIILQTFTLHNILQGNRHIFTNKNLFVYLEEICSKSLQHKTKHGSLLSLKCACYFLKKCIF